MTDDPMTPERRAEIRRKARQIAISRGLAVHPEPDAPSVPVTLPTENLFALRGLLQTGRLTPEQEPLARQKLADAAAAARQTTDPTSGDAA